MSRPLRIEYPGAWYHVMNRGLSRRAIFLDHKDYLMFLSTLEEACSLFRVRIAAYCLMPNHYHLLVHTPEGNLSRFMRHLSGVYTQRFNRLHKRDGPLFRGRFKAILIQANDYLLQVTRYIHLNPVKAGLVDRLARFRWSSHGAYVRKRLGQNAKWLDTRFVLGCLSPRRSKAVELYKKFMGEELPEEIQRFYSKKYWSPILGEVSFIERIREGILTDRGFSPAEIPEARPISGKAMVRKIDRAVSDFYGVSPASLRRSRRGEANFPRKITILLARELTGLRLNELREAYQAGSYRAIATSCHRLKHELECNKKIKTQYNQLLRNVVK